MFQSIYYESHCYKVSKKLTVIFHFVDFSSFSLQNETSSCVIESSINGKMLPFKKVLFLHFGKKRIVKKNLKSEFLLFKVCFKKV